MPRVVGQHSLELEPLPLLKPPGVGDYEQAVAESGNSRGEEDPLYPEEKLSQRMLEKHDPHFTRSFLPGSGLK